MVVEAIVKTQFIPTVSVKTIYQMGVARILHCWDHAVLHAEFAYHCDIIMSSCKVLSLLMLTEPEGRNTPA